MKPISISLTPGTDYNTASRRAVERIPVSPMKLSMVGWYDRERRTGGPIEACGDEPLKCARDYAVARGAEYRVASDRYEFYFSHVPEDAAELDPEMVFEIHRGLDMDRYENLQGG